jgi:hypothetical protein
MASSVKAPSIPSEKRRSSNRSPDPKLAKRKIQDIQIRLDQTIAGLYRITYSGSVVLPGGDKSEVEEVTILFRNELIDSVDNIVEQVVEPTMERAKLAFNQRSQNDPRKTALQYALHKLIGDGISGKSIKNFLASWIKPNNPVPQPRIER